MSAYGTSDGGSGGSSRASGENLLPVRGSRDGTELHPVAAHVGLAVAPLHRDAAVALGDGLQAAGGVQP